MKRRSTYEAAPSSRWVGRSMLIIGIGFELFIITWIAVITWWPR